MKAEFTAIIKNDGDWWLGWVEEVPGANAQEKTKDELLIILREAAKDFGITPTSTPTGCK